MCQFDNTEIFVNKHFICISEKFLECVSKSKDEMEKNRWVCVLVLICATLMKEVLDFYRMRRIQFKFAIKF